jgi:hypothetical protein
MKLPAASLLAISLLGAAESTAQTVQLPSFHYFATNSSVLVPDQGQVSMGGIGGAASGRSQFGGLPGNFSRGNTGSASGATVTAFVHDFEAWDQALLATAARRREALGQVRATAGSSPVVQGQSSAADSPIFSVAEIEGSRIATRSNQEREAEDYFARGRQAEAAGKLRLARVYFQMAERRASGALKQRARAEIAAIGVAVESAGQPAPR